MIFFFIMLRRPTKSQRTDTLLPYTTLFRSDDTAGATYLFKGEALDMSYIVEDDILQLIDLNVKGGNANSAASDTIFQKSRTMILASLGGGQIGRAHV